jgi:hypothetical protein
VIFTGTSRVVKFQVSVESPKLPAAAGRGGVVRMPKSHVNARLTALGAYIVPSRSRGASAPPT